LRSRPYHEQSCEDLRGLMVVGVSYRIGQRTQRPALRHRESSATLTPRTVVLVLLGLDEVFVDCLFAQCPACRDAMQGILPHGLEPVENRLPRTCYGSISSGLLVYPSISSAWTAVMTLTA
jgi:hypothetical protein